MTRGEDVGAAQSLDEGRAGFGRRRTTAKGGNIVGRGTDSRARVDVQMRGAEVGGELDWRAGARQTHRHRGGEQMLGRRCFVAGGRVLGLRVGCSNGKQLEDRRERSRRLGGLRVVHGGFSGGGSGS